MIVSGPSGAGKGTLVERVVDRVPGVWVSVSATTRPPRSGEVEGEHYLFLSPEGFERKVQRNEFLEHASVHGNRYGTLRSEVEARLQEGLHVILEIDVQGALQVKDAMPDAVLVFILAPSMEDLRKRLEARGSEDEEEVRKRLRTAEREVRLVDTYDYVIINDDAARATEELADIIRSLSREED